MTKSYLQFQSIRERKAATFGLQASTASAAVTREMWILSKK